MDELQIKLLNIFGLRTKEIDFWRENEDHLRCRFEITGISEKTIDILEQSFDLSLSTRGFERIREIINENSETLNIHTFTDKDKYYFIVYYNGRELSQSLSGGLTILYNRIVDKLEQDGDILTY